MDWHNKTFLIYGLGLMGGSLSLAIKKKIRNSTVIGISSREESKEKADKLKIVDAVYLEDDFLKNPNWEKIDLIIFSLPVELIVEKLKLIPSNFNGIITDIGSTKFEVISKIESLESFPKQYVSSHPMCGSEKVGVEHSLPDLYENKICLICSPKNSSKAVSENLIDFWNLIGMRIVKIDSDKHDVVLAFLSHTPHLISCLMASWASHNVDVVDETLKSPHSLVGSGFRDMTRIGEMNSSMWLPIIETNRENIYHSLLKFKDSLEEVIEHLSSKEKFNKNYWIKLMEDSKKGLKLILKK